MPNKENKEMDTQEKETETNHNGDVPANQEPNALPNDDNKPADKPNNEDSANDSQKEMPKKENWFKRNWIKLVGAAAFVLGAGMVVLAAFAKSGNSESDSDYELSEGDVTDCANVPECVED